MSECLKDREALVIRWASLYGQRGGDEGLTLHDSHITEFRGVPGIRGELGVGDDAEVAHIWTPSSSHPDKCALCHAPITCARPSPSEVEKANREADSE